MKSDLLFSHFEPDAECLRGFYQRRQPFFTLSNFLPLLVANMRLFSYPSPTFP